MIDSYWLALLMGGFLEICFVSMMKLSDGFRKLRYSILTIIFVILSLYSLSYALKSIPMGTGYAIWSGIGAVGSVLVGVIWFKESKSWKKMLFVSMVIIGIVGLKLSTN